MKLILAVCITLSFSVNAANMQMGQSGRWWCVDANGNQIDNDPNTPGPQPGGKCSFTDSKCINDSALECEKVKGIIKKPGHSFPVQPKPGADAEKPGLQLKGTGVSK